MPVIRRADDHRVDGLVVEHRAEVGECLRVRRQLRGLGEIRREDVADRRDLDLGKRQVRPHVGAALTAHADDADTHAIARAHGG